MIVEFSGEAESDLEQIVDYIAKDNPRRALSFVQELRGKCEALAYNPLAFPLVPRYERLRHSPPGTWELSDFLPCGRRTSGHCPCLAWCIGLRCRTL